MIFLQQFVCSLIFILLAVTSSVLIAMEFEKWWSKRRLAGRRIT